MSDVPAAVQNLERRFEGAKAVDGTSFTVHRAAWRGGVDHRIQWIRQDHDAERDLRHDPSAGGSITLDGLASHRRSAAAPIAEHGSRARSRTAARSRSSQWRTTSGDIHSTLRAEPALSRALAPLPAGLDLPAGRTVRGDLGHAGLAPGAQADRRRIDEIARLNRELGVSVLLVEQQAELALSIASRGCVPRPVRSSLTGSAREFLGDPRIQEAYLGRTA